MRVQRHGSWLRSPCEEILKAGQFPLIPWQALQPLSRWKEHCLWCEHTQSWITGRWWMCHPTANGCLELPPPFGTILLFKASALLAGCQREAGKAQLPDGSPRNTPGACRDVPGVSSTSAQDTGSLCPGLGCLNTSPCTSVTWEPGDGHNTSGAQQLLIFSKPRSLIFIYFSLPGFSQDIPSLYFLLIQYNGALLFNLLTREENKWLAGHFKSHRIVGTGGDL